MNERATKCLIWLLLLAAAAVASDGPVTGVFGLAPVPEGTALAVWVPLETAESISGVAWYNNDGGTVFPELLAVAGAANEPAALAEAVVVGEDVTGATLGWSEWTFNQPLASATPGLFLVFRLAAGDAFEAEGEGAGVGYQVGDGELRCWVCTEAGDWNPLSPEYQMAVNPVMNTDKSGDVLVLGGENRPAAEEPDLASPLVAGMTAAPNPFNPQTEIRFTLPAGGDVKLTIFDVRGRAVRTLVSGTLAAGAHAIVWNGRNDAGRAQASGVYLALLEAGPVRLTQRLTLVQ